MAAGRATDGMDITDITDGEWPARQPGMSNHPGMPPPGSVPGRRLQRGLESAGASCRLEVWPDQMHVFQALSRIVPEADRALDVAASFIDEQLEVQRRRAALTVVPDAKEA